ncbi:MAG: alpha/beta hydrolase [Chloroflexota bacterium]
MTKIPLALLPGTLCSPILWEDQIAALHDIADVRVIDTSQHDTIGALAQHIHTVMPARFAVAGLSYGGIVAFEVWRQKPNAISHLGLLNTTPFPVSTEKRAAQEALAEMALAGNFTKVADKQVQMVMLPEQYRQNYRLQSRVTRMADEIGVEGFINQIKAQVKRVDSRPILSDIRCPTLVLTGDQDQLCPPALHEEMAAKIPDSTLHILSACGHLSTMDQPAKVSAAMQAWLLS